MKFLNINKDTDVIELRQPFVNVSGFVNSDEIMAGTVYVILNSILGTPYHSIFTEEFLTNFNLISAINQGLPVTSQIESLIMFKILLAT